MTPSDLSFFPAERLAEWRDVKAIARVRASRAAFREDESRTWVGNAQANLVTLRHMVLALLKRDTSSKVGIKARRRKAGWSTDYLLKVLNA